LLNLEKILAVLNENKVNFIIIGGQAAVAFGSAYSTFDFDFCYSRKKENLENIVKALKPFHPFLRGADKNLPFVFDSKTLKMGLNFTFSTDIGDIDLLGEISGIGKYDDMLKYSETLEIYEMPCKVLTLEGLIKSKKASGRPKDLILLKELEALVEIRKQLNNKKPE
jgi:predicted nucleotidyltransferase